MDKQHEKTSKKAGGAEGGPMAMGMAMAKKMMGQMGQGGNPMEMMQKMMAQMGHGEGMPPMMAMCMGMCSEMLNAIRQTNALAVFSTPELQHVFADWVKGLEAKAAEIVSKGQTDAADVAKALQISEESANYVLGRLAASGKVTLTGKART